jgi:hypothetical protein
MFPRQKLFVPRKNGSKTGSVFKATSSIYLEEENMKYEVIIYYSENNNNNNWYP